MADKIVVVDFSGTLIKSEVIEEANEFRSKVLQRSLPTKEEHAKSDELYKVNREFVEKLTGLTKEKVIFYRENNLEFMRIPAEQYNNQISTNLFQIGMYGIAKKHGLKIFPEGLVEQLKRIRKIGYRLAIVSGVRTDIISGMLQISGLDFEFDHIYAQPPILGVSNEENIIALSKKGKITYILGDKMEDLKPAKSLKAKSIFVKWGHATGGEEEFADYSIENAEELEKIIV